MTCSMLCEMRITEMPSSIASRMSLSTLEDSRAPSAEVGSSRITIRLPKAIARAQATAWRWPPESSPISALGSGSLTCRRSISSSVSRRIAPSSTHANGPSQEARVRSRPAKKLPTGPVLSNSARSWKTVSMPSSRARCGRVDPDALAVEPDLAAVGLLDAREDLDQRRLARAVVAQQREHLALVQGERDVAQRGRRAVLLAQVLDLEDGLRGAVAALPRARTAS